MKATVDTKYGGVIITDVMIEDDFKCLHSGVDIHTMDDLLICCVTDSSVDELVDNVERVEQLISDFEF